MSNGGPGFNFPTPHQNACRYMIEGYRAMDLSTFDVQRGLNVIDLRSECMSHNGISSWENRPKMGEPLP